MKHIHNYLKLFRVKHWFKNLLIFVPLFFSKMLFDYTMLMKTIYGFFAFSLLASSIYVINDMHDVEKDRLHPVKRQRPLASGKISLRNARLSVLVLLIISCLLLYFITPEKIFLSSCTFLSYFLINLFYSIGKGKDLPLIDIFILMLGYVFRIIFGASLTNITISVWLYLVVMSGSFYLGLGKRRNEIKETGSKSSTRAVLKYYTYEFLDKNMYVCMTSMIIFYSLWCSEQSNSSTLILTIPIIYFAAMRYSLDIEKNCDGDPINVILHDKILFLIGFIYCLIMLLAIY